MSKKIRDKIYRDKNKEKVKAYNKEWCNLNKDYDKNQKLVKLYGITLEDYESLLKNQNFVCSICGKPESKVSPKSGVTFSLAVDHCHTTGKVRSLLCQRCNRTLGFIEENPEILLSMFEYLKNHSIKDN